jgi:hypothetical protein
VPDALWWALSAALILIGLAGIVLPALPGTVLVFGRHRVGMVAKVVPAFVMVGIYVVALMF